MSGEHTGATSVAAPGRRNLRARLQQARFAPLLLPSRRRLGYLGWLGYDNVGDEAMYVACQRAFAALDVEALPDVHNLRRLVRLSPRPLLTGVALGGGTLIGHEEYRLPFETVWSRHPDTPGFILGSGVEDPQLDRAGTPSATRRAELARWKPIMDRCAFVGVRGPRSARILEEVGVQASVVGDSALLLGGGSRTQPEPGLVGINTGVARVQWGDDPARVTAEFVELSRKLHGAGYRVRLISMMPSDTPVLEHVRAEARIPAEVVATYDTDSTLASMATCEALVGLKLHSVILASAVDVPSVMVEYQPKGADFMESIGREAYNMRTADFHHGPVAELVDGLVAGGVAEREVVRQRCDVLRGRWDAATSAIQRAVLGR